MKKITFASRDLNKLLDQTLMQKHQFASETLMELAGVAVAQVAHQILKQICHQNQEKEHQSVCVLVGPGNNGGDGLVAARHLKMMNHTVDLVTFKKLQGKNGNYLQLCSLNQIPNSSPEDFKENDEIGKKFTDHLKEKSLIIDSVFGFPFTGQIRQPYKDFIALLQPFEKKILSVDIPSGWDANQGNIHSIFTPAYLISLGIPKQCSESYKGEHYFGGRFIPESIRKELGVELPQFQEDSLYCRL